VIRESRSVFLQHYTVDIAVKRGNDAASLLYLVGLFVGAATSSAHSDLFLLVILELVDYQH